MRRILVGAGYNEIRNNQSFVLTCGILYWGLEK